VRAGGPFRAGGRAVTTQLASGYTPAIVAAPGGAVDVVAVDRLGALVHRRFRDRRAIGEGVRVNDTRVFAGSPVLVRGRDGDLHLFCRDVRGHVRHARGGPDGWSAWDSIGTASRPRRADGGEAGRGDRSIHRGYEGDSRVLTRPAPVSRSFPDVRVSASIAAVLGEDDRIELFAHDLNRTLWRSVEREGGRFAPWHHVPDPGLYTEISAVTGSGGPVLVGASRDGGVWTGWTGGPDTGEYRPCWSRLDAHVTAAPTVWSNRGRYAILGRGADARAWRAGGSTGGFTAWAPIPGTPSLPVTARMTAAAGTDGALHVCVSGVHGEMWHVREAPDGVWSRWAIAGGPVASQLSAEVDPDGGIWLTGVGPDGGLVLVHRSAEDG